MTNLMQPKPVGQRPHCLQCDRELRPNYKTERLPLHVPTGAMVQVRKPGSYGLSVAEYEEWPENRPTTDEERKAFKLEHPPQWDGTYGSYRDSRFCGLRCGYHWAVRHCGPQA